MNTTDTYIYKEEHIADFLQKRIDRRIKELLPYTRGAKKILELGCGKGLLAARLKKYVDAEFFGTDISQSGIRLAKKRGIQAIRTDLNKPLPYKDNTFDVIFSDQLLEHIYDTDMVVGEMYRTLKSGGYGITITPNLSFWLNRILFPFGVYPLFLETSLQSKLYGLKFLKHFVKETESVGHIHVFNKAALIDMFESNTFDVIDVKGLPLSWSMPQPFQLIYDAIDALCALMPSIARDLVIVVKKP